MKLSTIITLEQAELRTLRAGMRHWRILFGHGLDRIFNQRLRMGRGELALLEKRTQGRSMPLEEEAICKYGYVLSEIYRQHQGRIENLSDSLRGLPEIEASVHANKQAIQECKEALWTLRQARNKINDSQQGITYEHPHNQ